MDWKTTGSSRPREATQRGSNSAAARSSAALRIRQSTKRSEVKQVALIYLPTSGSLDEMHVELHDYDEAVAIAALGRLDTVYALLATVDVENSPDLWR
jgi:hypothetical protein